MIANTFPGKIIDRRLNDLIMLLKIDQEAEKRDILVFTSIFKMGVRNDFY